MKQEICVKLLENYTKKIMGIIKKLPGYNACVLFTKGTEDGLEVMGTYSIANPYFDDDTHKAIIDSWKEWLDNDPSFESKPTEEE